MKILKKSKKVVISMALTAVLVLSSNLAAFAAWGSAYVPTLPAIVGSNVITVAAHRDAQVSPEILGLNVVATSQIGGASPYTITYRQGERVPISTAQENPMLKIFGSSLNDSFDPYYNNFLYNSYIAANFPLLTTTNEVLSTAAGGPNGADVIGSGASATSISLDQRPDILLGVAPNSSGTSYQDIIAGISGYNPELVSYQLTTSYDILDGLKDLAAAVNNVRISEPSKTTRYGNPVTIASDYENYVKGLQAYIVKNINAGVVDKQKVAIVNPTPNADGTYKAYDKTVSSGTAAVCRAAEYVAYTTTNVTSGKTKDADGTYHLTATDVELADVIIIAGITNIGNDGSAAEAAFEADLNSKLSSTNTKPILSSLPITAYGMFMNSVDNALGFGYYNGFIYGNSILNPTHASAYFFERFYHISNSTNLQNAITECFSTVANDGIGSSLTGYCATDIQAKILEGWNYYSNNAAIFARTELSGWNMGGSSTSYTLYNSNTRLNSEQMTGNAQYIYDYLLTKGWTKNAICAMLGNMETESYLNPGVWQDFDEGNLAGGYGLTQWTPATKYIYWAIMYDYEPYNIHSQLARILDEVRNNIQYTDPDKTFKEFTQSTDSVYNLAVKFLKYYEKSGNTGSDMQNERGTQAEGWYDRLF